MNIKAALEREHSKTLTLAIVDYVGSDESKFAELMECFLSKNKRLCQRSAWPLGMITDHKLWLLKPYYSELIQALKNPTHDAVLRNIFRAFAMNTIPEEIEGELYEEAWKHVSNPKCATAIRAHSVSVLEKVSYKYPELKEELIPMLREIADHGTIGFKNRAKKIIAKLTRP